MACPLLDRYSCTAPVVFVVLVLPTRDVLKIILTIKMLLLIEEIMNIKMDECN